MTDTKNDKNDKNDKVTKVEIAKFKNDTNLTHDDLVDMQTWLNTTRYDNGLKNLQSLMAFSNTVKAAIETKGNRKFKPLLNTLLNCDYDTCFSKPDQAAITKISESSHKDMARWYQDTMQTCVSPRTIWTKFEDKQPEEKTDFEKLKAMLESLSKKSDKAQKDKKVSDSQWYELRELMIPIAGTIRENCPISIMEAESLAAEKMETETTE